MTFIGGLKIELHYDIQCFAHLVPACPQCGIFFAGVISSQVSNSFSVNGRPIYSWWAIFTELIISIDWFRALWFSASFTVGSFDFLISHVLFLQFIDFMCRCFWCCSLHYSSNSYNRGCSRFSIFVNERMFSSGILASGLVF